MTNVLDIYKSLAVRINYPIEPTYRCLQKIIGYLNLLISLTNTPQVTIEVELSGEPGKRYYNKVGEKVAYLKSGKPCKLNPDGTINTSEKTGYVIRTGLFQDFNSGASKKFVTSETDVLSDGYYLQPILTALFLAISGVSPGEAVMYINDACTKSVSSVDTSMIDVNKAKRRL